MGFLDEVQRRSELRHGRFINQTYRAPQIEVKEDDINDRAESPLSKTPVAAEKTFESIGAEEFNRLFDSKRHEPLNIPIAKIKFM